LGFSFSRKENRGAKSAEEFIYAKIPLPTETDHCFLPLCVLRTFAVFARERNSRKAAKRRITPGFPCQLPLPTDPCPFAFSAASLSFREREIHVKPQKAQRKFHQLILLTATLKSNSHECTNKDHFKQPTIDTAHCDCVSSFSALASKK
jgi:hypothetical protein